MFIIKFFFLLLLRSDLISHQLQYTFGMHQVLPYDNNESIPNLINILTYVPHKIEKRGKSIILFNIYRADNDKIKNTILKIDFHTRM